MASSSVAGDEPFVWTWRTDVGQERFVESLLARSSGIDKEVVHSLVFDSHSGERQEGFWDDVAAGLNRVSVRSLPLVAFAYDITLFLAVLAELSVTNRLFLLAL